MTSAPDPVGSPPGGRRTRRYDPERRQRLVAAALEVIARVGLANTTHRNVADAADVPLGSTTYHFASLDDLLGEAMAGHGAVIADALDARMQQARGREAALDALARHLADDLLGSERALALTIELYAEAARQSRRWAGPDAWLIRVHRTLEEHFSPDTAQELDAVLKGLVLHCAQTTRTAAFGQFRDTLQKFAERETG